MFADSITLDFKGTGDLVLLKRKEDGYSSEYAATVDVYDVTMTIKHTFPPSRVSGQTSHLVRMDVKEYDSTTGLQIRSFSTWRVIATTLGRQDNTTVTELYNSMSAFLDSTNLTSLITGSS
jgi:hypothetical protein